MSIIIKRTLAVLIFIVIFVTLYFYIGFILTPKNMNDVSSTKYLQTKALYHEKRNTLDVLFCGNSDLYRGFIPAQFYNETGITSYNAGQGRQPLNAVVKQVKRVINQQKLKMLVLETDFFFHENGSFMGANFYDYSTFISPIIYHSRWKDLEISDCFKQTNYKDYFFKGYVYTDVNSNYKLSPNYMKDPTQECEKLEKSVLKDLKKINKMCNKHNIKLVFTTFPTPITWTNKKHNAVQKLAEEYNVKYIDMNLPESDLDFDYENSFMDEGNHCNYNGAKVITSYLSNYFKENYHFEDRRNDPKYKHWKHTQKLYEEFIRDKN